MRIRDGYELIGKNVICSDGLECEIIGELIEVYGTPWKMRVRILGINRGSPIFKLPLSYGSIHSYFGYAAKPYEKPIRPYIDSYISILLDYKSKLEKLLESSPDYFLQRMLYNVLFRLNDALTNPEKYYPSASDC